MIVITDKQKEIINRLNDPIYTLDFLSQWINRRDSVFANAPSALQAMGAKGFYSAIVAIEKLENGI